MRGGEVSFAFDFSARVLDRDCKSAGAHGRKIDHIVADERGFFRLQSRLPHDRFEASALIVDALVDVFEFQVAGANRNRFRTALGDNPSLDAAEASQRNCGAIVSVKTLGLNDALAVQAKAALAGMFIRRESVPPGPRSISQRPCRP